MSTDKSYQDFDVPLGEHLLGSLIGHTRGLWLKMADLETSYLADAIEGIEVERPVYVAGLARAGSTILLEILSSVPGMATHCYKDFPAVLTPVWWNALLNRVPKQHVEPVERSHRDGIAVTPDSPEAVEEVLWMAYFAHLHDPERTNVLDRTTTAPRFEKFYKAHVRKLLHLRVGRRYLSKGNYNVSRMDYLLKLFPGARFVLPVRQPVSHVASMIKQHALFCRAQRESPRGRAYLRRLGHFEFGLDRLPINVGRTETTRSIIELWQNGEEARGWARYWADIYGFVADRLEADADLRAATLVVRFEELCAKPEETLSRLAAHCSVEPAARFVSKHAGRLHAPDYYRPDFSAQDEAAIIEETEAAVARFDRKRKASA